MIRHRLFPSIMLFFLLQITLFPLWMMGNYSLEPADESFNFIEYGDTRATSQPNAVSLIHEDIVNSFLQHNPEFIVHTGDMVLAGGIWSQWLEFNESIAPILEANIPFYGIVGNHEKYTEQYYQYDSDFSNYTTYFDFSSVIDETGETELYYSFDYEGIHFIFLNTEDFFNDTEGGSNEFNCSLPQMNWLLSDLSNKQPDDFIVVHFHRTAWSIRDNNPNRWAEAKTVRDDFHEILIQHGVDLVFMGHDHYYYRTIRDGIYYVTTGGGGAPLADIDPNPPIWQEGDIAYSEYHYCNVEVNSTHVKVTALCTNSIILDSFTINKATTTTPTTTPTTYPFPPIPPELIIISIIIVVIIVILVLYIRRRKA
jgi:3',5'-cyclic AMP phosphodiesterase CpdA